jgi:hypothetical protein
MKSLETTRRLENFLANDDQEFQRSELPDSCRKLSDWTAAHATAPRSTISPHRISATLGRYALTNNATEPNELTQIDGPTGKIFDPVNN